jgi:hypothetical protein
MAVLPEKVDSEAHPYFESVRDQLLRSATGGFSGIEESIRV